MEVLWPGEAAARNLTAKQGNCEATMPYARPCDQAMLPQGPAAKLGLREVVVAALDLWLMMKGRCLVVTLLSHEALVVLFFFFFYFQFHLFLSTINSFPYLYFFLLLVPFGNIETKGEKNI